MTLDDLIAALSELAQTRDLADADADAGAEDPENFNCTGCEDCRACRFCTDCTGCEECTYCEECWDCSGCIQCKRAIGCVSCSYVEDSRDCERSRYLRLCIGCRDCVHCLGCVDLADAEFCVLNKKYSRSDYFALLKRVVAELDTRLDEGWRPDPVWGETDEVELEVEQSSHDVGEGSEVERESDLFSVAAESRPVEGGPESSTVLAGEGETKHELTRGSWELERRGAPSPPADVRAGRRSAAGWAMAVARAGGRSDGHKGSGAESTSTSRPDTTRTQPPYRAYRGAEASWLDDENFAWLDDAPVPSRAAHASSAQRPRSSEPAVVANGDGVEKDAVAKSNRTFSPSSSDLDVEQDAVRAFDVANDPDAHRGGLRQGRPPRRVDNDDR